MEDREYIRYGVHALVVYPMVMEFAICNRQDYVLGERNILDC